MVRRSWLRLLCVLVLGALLAAACGSDRSEGGGDEGATTTTEKGGGGDQTFGTLESPCGSGDANANNSSCRSPPFNTAMRP